MSLVSGLHGAMSLASWLCGKKKTNASSNDPLLCCLSQLALEVELLKPIIEQKNVDGFEDGLERTVEEMNKDWGPIVSHYLKCHWECVLCYKSLTASLNHSSINTSSPVTLCFIDAVQLAKVCTDSLDAGSNDAIVTVCKCMTLLVPEVATTNQFYIIYIHYFCVYSFINLIVMTSVITYPSYGSSLSGLKISVKSFRMH